MLTPEQLQNLPDALVSLFAVAESDILGDMARRIAAYDYFIPAAEHQLRLLEQAGMERAYILRRLAAMTRRTTSELETLLTQAVTAAADLDLAAVGIDNRDVLSVAPSSVAVATAVPTVVDRMTPIIQSGLANTAGLFQNLTRTTANTATRQFENALDRAWLQVSTGAFSYDTAVHTAVKSLAREGIHAIAYPSGWRDKLDVAVRRAVVTGVNQTAAKVSVALADELDCPLVYVTAHAGARPDHAVWQGKIYGLHGDYGGYPSLVEATGYGSGAGLCGWNCRHSFGPHLEGTSPPYPQALLDEYNQATVFYDGQEMSLYDATQKQRYMERQIRRWKREYNAMSAAGLPTGEASAKLAHWRATEKQFRTETGLKDQRARQQVVGFGKSAAASASASSRKLLQESAQRDIIIRQLRAVGVEGVIHYPKQVVDISTLTFDDAHINGERQHGVTEAEAKGFIENAAVSVTRWNGQREHYFGHMGVAYLDTTKNEIRTAFGPAQFDPTVKAIMEVLEKNGL